MSREQWRKRCLTYLGASVRLWAAAVAETADVYRVLALSNLDIEGRAALGQYMTAMAISQFMADLFSETKGEIRAPDARAGVGPLTAALAERVCAPTHRAISFTQTVSSFSDPICLANPDAGVASSTHGVLTDSE